MFFKRRISVEVLWLANFNAQFTQEPCYGSLLPALETPVKSTPEADHHISSSSKTSFVAQKAERTVTYLWSRCAMISPPGKAEVVASYDALIDCFQLPPMLLSLVLPFESFGSSIGKEYPESKWLTQTPSFLKVFKENIHTYINFQKPRDK